jgi:hypothetical protein
MPLTPHLGNWTGEQGIQEASKGSPEGHPRGAAALAWQRFGNEVTAYVEQRIATASVEENEAWSARVLSAATISELFAD